jgi:rRNA-processing protein FCF1
VSNWLLQLVERHATSGIVIDTNILMLLFVGTTQRDLIPRFDRTAQFAPEDYDILLQFLAPFSRLITTPNILTEVSNLSKKLQGHVRSQYFTVFAATISDMREHYFESRKATQLGLLSRLGLADSATILLAREGHLVLTDDHPLYQTLQSEGLAAINFNHVRPLNWT